MQTLEELQTIVDAQQVTLELLEGKIKSMEAATASSVVFPDSKPAPKILEAGKEKFQLIRPKFSVQSTDAEGKITVTPVDLSILDDKALKKALETYPSAFIKL